ncbi:MAG TPA: alcohol dehydrogenase catalytic domain-containing protein [Acidimicrobiales bacterium]|nr:alcohol dehydrogenase catalytic domain-containing protein [Acidimicrobiales bacterium]
MRALRVLGPGGWQVQLVDTQGPLALGEGEVVLATLAVGVCGSDVHAWHGTQTYPMKYPVTLGHEAVGRIAEIGPGVTGWSVGERVVSETARSVCGACLSCREGRYNLCAERLGFGALYDGAMAETFVSRAQILHRVPDDVPDEVLAVTEPYCVAYNAVVERARVRPGDVVTIIGPGPVGMFSAQVALAAGAATVHVAGLPGDEARLAVAAASGAVAVTAEGPWWEEPGRSGTSDLVVDASGASGTLEPALGLVRPGGQVVKVGWGPEPYGRPLDVLVAKAVELHGSFSHTWATWERVLRLMGLGRLSPSPAGAAAGLRTYTLTDWRAAFTAMAERRVVKSVLVL